MKAWEEKREYVYCIVMKNNDTDDGLIVKIGGTRTGMKDRFGSYLCGHHVIERNKSGKMSVTNAHLYHTIEHGLYIKNNLNFGVGNYLLVNLQLTYSVMRQRLFRRHFMRMNLNV